MGKRFPISLYCYVHWCIFSSTDERDSESITSDDSSKSENEQFEMGRNVQVQVKSTID